MFVRRTTHGTFFCLQVALVLLCATCLCPDVFGQASPNCPPGSRPSACAKSCSGYATVCFDACANKGSGKWKCVDECKGSMASCMRGCGNLCDSEIRERDSRPTDGGGVQPLPSGSTWESESPPEEPLPDRIQTFVPAVSDSTLSEARAAGKGVITLCINADQFPAPLTKCVVGITTPEVEFKWAILHNKTPSFTGDDSRIWCPKYVTMGAAEGEYLAEVWCDGTRIASRPATVRVGEHTFCSNLPSGLCFTQLGGSDGDSGQGDGEARSTSDTAQVGLASSGCPAGTTKMDEVTKGVRILACIDGTGQPQVAVEGYSLDGQMLIHTDYRDGLQHGRHLRWNTDGVLLEEGQYVKGKKEGKWILREKIGKAGELSVAVTCYKADDPGNIMLLTEAVASVFSCDEQESANEGKPPFDEDHVRLILLDIALGNTYGYFAAHADGPDVAEAIRRWDAGTRISNLKSFERKIVQGSWHQVYSGTDRQVLGAEVKLTSD